jgi:hypothetical protein
MPGRWSGLCAFGALVVGGVLVAARERGDSAPVYVTLWFDTEDYILPQSDDAAKRLAEILTDIGVKGTFKIVGEKARVLERRGRLDVIRALQKHEIGYHTDFHSRQPTPAVYLQNAGWEEGAQEFLRREGPGALDVQRIFGVPPVCYGQPGSSWAPQAHLALRQMGIKSYLDESRHVGLNSQPYYFGGMLNIINLGRFVTRLELDEPGNLDKAKEGFRRAADALRAQQGGTVSIYYHPCEFVHAEFWDGVNFRRGRNPPPAEWKLPAVKPPAAIEKGFADFEAYIRFVRSEPGVSFKTVAELEEIYADRSVGRSFGAVEISEAASAVRSEITFTKLGEVWLSGADVFSLLTEVVESFLERDLAPVEAAFSPLDGPARPFVPSNGGTVPAEIPWPAFASTVKDVASFCREHRRIPQEVWIGAAAISPADFLATLGGAVEDILKTGSAPASVPRRTGRMTADRHVAEDSPSLWGWIIFPEGFRAPAIMEQARLQAWTLKPAERH